MIESQLIEQEKMTMLVANSTRRKSNPAQRRPVRCVETGVVYASSGDASDILSFEGNLINPRSILYVCQGKQKVAGGLKWEYADINLIASLETS